MEPYSHCDATGSSTPKKVVGGMAQWLGRWSLAGRFFLACAQSIVDRWPWSTMGQQTRPTQPSIPQGLV